MRTVVPKPTIGGKGSRLKIRRKNWQRHAVFLKSVEGALVANAGRPTSAKRGSSRRYDFCHPPCQGRARVVRTSCGGSRETRETREQHEIDQKSREIEAEERQKRDEKEVLAGGKRSERQKHACARERDGRRVRHAGRQVYEYVHCVRTHQHTWICVPRHTERAYALASLVPFKNSRSYRVFVLLYHSPPLPPPVRRAAPRRAARIPDLEGCNKL